MPHSDATMFGFPALAAWGVVSSVVLLALVALVVRVLDVVVRVRTAPARG